MLLGRLIMHCLIIECRKLKNQPKLINSLYSLCPPIYIAPSNDILART